MFICSKCGAKTEHLRVEKEWHHEFEAPCYEEIEINECPICGAKETMEIGVECNLCGQAFLDFTNEGNVCDECIEKYETVGEALSVGAVNTLDVKGINGFIVSVLSTEQINKILGKWVEENFIDHSKPVKAYLEEDKVYFIDWIENKYGE